MIRFQAVIDDPLACQRGNLPRRAVRLDAPATMEELQKKAWPIAALLCAVLPGCMAAKTLFSHVRVVHPLFLFIGVLLGAALLPVHEWLHAMVYPSQAQVTIGRLKGKMVFVALCSHPLSRARFILMCLLPFVLGLVPLTLFLLLPPDMTMANGLLFGMACMGMVSPYPDVYNVMLVLQQAKPRDAIMFDNNDLYRIPYVPHAARHSAD